MGDTIKNLFKYDQPHELKAREMAIQIFNEQSDLHSDMVKIIKDTLEQLHSNVKESIKKA